MTQLVYVNVTELLPLVDKLIEKITTTVSKQVVTQQHRVALQEYIFNRIVVTNLNSYRLYRYSSVTDYVRYDLTNSVIRYQKEIDLYATYLPNMYDTVVTNTNNDTIINTLLVNDILYVSLNET